MKILSEAFAVLFSSSLIALAVLSGCSNHHLVSIAITPQNASVSQIGQTTQFIATGTSNSPRVPPKDVTAASTWTSSTQSVATINSSGLATAVGCGTTTISAADGGITGSTTFTVTCTTSGGSNPILQSISLYPGNASIPQVGQTTQFIALGAYAPPSGNNNLTGVVSWQSSNVSIASINNAGLATAASCGTTTITGQYQGILGQTQLTVACTVAPNPVLQSITLYPSNPSVSQLGQSVQFMAIGVYSPASGNNVLTNTASWASSNTSIATVNPTGLATVVACGTTTITAQSQGVVGQMPLTVQCNASQSLQSLAVLPNNPTVPVIGQSTQFLALGTFAGGGQEDLTSTATWSSSNPEIATINSSGTALTVGCGTSTISAQYRPSGGTPVVGTSSLNVSCNSITSIELIIVKSGSSSGTVTSVPAGINCGTVCGGLFNEGTGFVLTATPASGATATWNTTECDQIISGQCYFTLVPDTTGGTSKTVTVTFQ